ncbi:MAG: NTP transferase domain-containing protein [Treponemataceae bacterium]|nr:NTP transferase domain-containing protein [Treponemataceae bacterium]
MSYKGLKMNTREVLLLKIIKMNKCMNQRFLAKKTGFSLGNVNKLLNNLTSQNFIDFNNNLTEKAELLFSDNQPQRAIILAAGYGMRMVPVNVETPKGLLIIDNETLIERIIKQLHEVNIYEIYVVVGFMKESYEFLIDKYGVKLICNPEYAKRNNLHSLFLASDFLSDAYIVPCDVWCRNNEFNTFELNSWYLINDDYDEDSEIIVNKKMELLKCHKSNKKKRMIGIAYINKEDSVKLKTRLKELDDNSKYDSSFWEEAAFFNNKMIFSPNTIAVDSVVEINTYEQLRSFSPSNRSLKHVVLDTISDVFNVSLDSIKNIKVLKKGMTNRSFIFSCGDARYIMRIPGEGTDMLIDRRQEYDVYEALKEKDICDTNVYFNPETGYKITKYIENSRVCNPYDQEDLEKCMRKLNQFHELGLKVKHSFDIFRQTEFYESLWEGKPSSYKDYINTKNNVFSLKHFIDSQKKDSSLTHIDAVPDNFLIYNNTEGKECISLIDWEYAGMQDPHVDIAMFCIYSLYNKEQVDNLIETYFKFNKSKCNDDIITKIYCYISACGLLWSNWCEYKSSLGVEFGEYSLCQYRYAKDYYKIAIERIRKNQDE